MLAAAAAADAASSPRATLRIQYLFPTTTAQNIAEMHLTLDNTDNDDDDNDPVDRQVANKRVLPRIN